MATPNTWDITDAPDAARLKAIMQQLYSMHRILGEITDDEEIILENAIRRGKLLDSEYKKLQKNESLLAVISDLTELQLEAQEKLNKLEEINLSNIANKSLSVQKETLKTTLDRLEARKKELETELKVLEQTSEINEVDKQRLEILESQYKSINELYTNVNTQLDTVNKKLADKQKEIEKRLDEMDIRNMSKRSKRLHDLEKQQESKYQEEKKLIEEIAEARANNRDDEAEQGEKRLKDLQKETKEIEKQVEAHKAGDKYRKAAWNQAVSSANELTSLMSTYSQYALQINTRLQGSNRTFSGISNKVTESIGASGYVSQQQLMQKISEAVSSGIEYNVEQRAFLATISDKIANTFDAFDSNLTRLIRIQQADSTAARLGMENILTEFLNSQYGDTSYLNQLSKSVSAAVLDAESIMSRNDAMQFEYTLQKWFGSLYSLGLSENAIMQLAQGINYLGTGDISALAGNSALSVLMPMAANRAGIPYGTTLTGTLNAEKTNLLLMSMVEYLQEISKDTNNVVRSAYGDIYNLSMSDISAIQNLTSSDIANIAQNTLTYNQALEKVNDQLRTGISSRTPISLATSTVFENIKWQTASYIADNPLLYGGWLLNDFVEKVTGGINIPNVGVFGNFIDLGANMNQLIRLAMVGVGMIGRVGEIAQGVTDTLGGRAPGLFSLGFQEFTPRGEGFNLLDQGYGDTTSLSSYVGSGSGKDVYTSTLTDATASAQEVGSITNAGTANDHVFEDFWQAVFVEKVPITITTPANSKSIDDIYYTLDSLKEILSNASGGNYINTKDRNTNTDYDTALGVIAKVLSGGGSF